MKTLKICLWIMVLTGYLGLFFLASGCTRVIRVPVPVDDDHDGIHHKHPEPREHGPEKPKPIHPRERKMYAV